MGGRVYVPLGSRIREELERIRQERAEKIAKLAIRDDRGVVLSDISAYKPDGAMLPGMSVTVRTGKVTLNFYNNGSVQGKYCRAQLKADILPIAARNAKVTWRSSNTAVATVSQTGLVEAKRHGTVDISATLENGYVASTRIQVTNFSKGPISEYRNMASRIGHCLPNRNNGTERNNISSGYKERPNGPHVGIDFASANSISKGVTPIISATKGKVHAVQSGRRAGDGGRGNYIVIESDDPALKDPVSGRQLVFIYQHLDGRPRDSSGRNYSNNNPVSRGDTVGFMGDTGGIGDLHLHYEISNRSASHGGWNTNKVFPPMINPIYLYPGTFFTGNAVEHQPDVRANHMPEAEPPKTVRIR
jgi:murein DD-endopeptidase MepM/ murein hydrolase activator NlpD